MTVERSRGPPEKRWCRVNLTGSAKVASMGASVARVLGLGLCLASVAAAQEPTGPDTLEAAASRWYGWQNWMADTAIVIFVAVRWDRDPEQTGQIAAVSYLLSGPVVHWSHRNVGRGFISLGSRVLAPILFALSTADIPSAHEPKWVVAALTIPALVDATVLAYDDVEPVTPSGTPRAVPGFQYNTKTAGLSLTGSF